MITTPASIAVRYARIPGVRVYDVHHLDDGWCHYVVVDAQGLARVAILNEDWVNAEPTWRRFNLPHEFRDLVPAHAEPWLTLYHVDALVWINTYDLDPLTIDNLITDHFVQLEELP